jgi:AcrR family transcriptional regulator
MSRRMGAGLTRERVLEAGLNLVDREGVSALTMRRLGRELGVEAMSLYGYVASKQDLLDGVVECVYRELPRTVGSDGPWQERLREIARGFRQVLLRHPNTVGLMAGRPWTSEASLDLVESALTELRRCGLDVVRASQVVTVIVAFTVGHVTSEVGDRATPPDPDVSFALGLDFVVAGVERLVDSVLRSEAIEVASTRLRS